MIALHFSRRDRGRDGDLSCSRHRSISLLLSLETDNSAWGIAMSEQGSQREGENYRIHYYVLYHLYTITSGYARMRFLLFFCGCEYQSSPMYPAEES